MDIDYLPSPEIRFYNRLKQFFRRFETGISRRRMIIIRRIINHLYFQGHLVAIDILGSMNFGMSEASSDMDAVLYYEENSFKEENELAKIAEIELIINNFLKKRTTDSGEKFSIQIVDKINIRRVMYSVDFQDPYCYHLQSFLLYRSISRGVHVRIHRELESKIIQRPELMMYLEESMKDSFRELLLHPTSRFSFSKYCARLEAEGKSIPPDIAEMLNFYLEGQLEKLWSPT